MRRCHISYIVVDRIGVLYSHYGVSCDPKYFLVVVTNQTSESFTPPLKGNLNA